VINAPVRDKRFNVCLLQIKLWYSILDLVQKEVLKLNTFEFGAQKADWYKITASNNRTLANTCTYRSRYPLPSKLVRSPNPICHHY